MLFEAGGWEAERRGGWRSVRREGVWLEEEGQSEWRTVGLREGRMLGRERRENRGGSSHGNTGEWEAICEG